MGEKKTPSENLEERLLQAENIESFLRENAGEFAQTPLAEYLAQLLREKGMTRSEAVRRSNIEATYAYHIFSGDKVPQRPKLLALAFALRLTPTEAQRLLRCASRTKLYARDPWDAVILYGLKTGQSLADVNEILDGLQLEPLLG